MAFASRLFSLLIRALDAVFCNALCQCLIKSSLWITWLCWLLVSQKFFSYTNTYRCLPLWLLLCFPKHFLVCSHLSATDISPWRRDCHCWLSLTCFISSERSFSPLFCAASCQCLPLARLCASSKGRWWPWWGHETSVAMLVARDGERKWCCPLNRWVGSHVLLPPESLTLPLILPRT